MLSGSNQVLSTYSYSDYGRRDKKYNPFVSSSDEYGYRSEAHNSDETQYLRARYYDTVTELFISADGYRGDWQDPLSQNRYNYGRNNPNKYFDPTGKWSVWGAIKGAVNSAAKAVNKVVQTVKNAFTPPKKSPQPKNSYTPPKKSTPTQNVTNPTGARTAPPIYSKYDKAIQYTAPSNNNNNYNNNGSSNGGSGGGSGSKSSGKNTTAQSQAEAQKAAELFRQRIEEQHGTLMKSVQKAKAGLAEKEQEKRKVEAIMASIQEPRFNLEFLNKMGSLYNRVSGWCKERGKEIKEVGDNFKKGAKELGDQLNEALLGGLQHVSDTIGSVSEAISKLTWKDVGKATVTTIAAGLTFAAIFVPGGGVVGAVINGFAAGGAAGAAGSLASSTFEIVDAVQANSEDELLKKYNAKDWAELAHNYLEQAGNSMVHGSIAGGVAAGTQAYIDSKLHPEGSVVQSGNETIDEVKPYANSRPSYRKGVVDEVWENAKGPDGLVRDPNTGEVINWTPGDSRNGVWDMGHVPGQKYSVMHDAYMKGIISKQEFLDWYNDPSNYRPELPSNNRSHMYE